ncbi:MAG: aminotransferase class I/II-fold pyridoxal phosphate-dependent enzyme [Clostridia bacterium]|jgi:arginine/lysine/ornithine decarboxylase|nr:aminotransferase class I/II-fold pyridoxal phosphate-dependent enzyme [Clostridia bacterium]MBT7122870.1 aminotransferase class I/II-fold pyridoxal phosphate-dependent enzyme [Clostridia bacterium]
MERKTPIMDAIYSAAKDSKARFCMPGHKGDTGFFGGDMLRFDITELPGVDNLLAPSGVIKQSEQLHADFIGAEQAHYTTGGSTAGVHAMLSLFGGKKVIFARGVHASVANAIVMFDIKPVYLPSQACDYPRVTSTDAVKTALGQHKDAVAVFIVYPNYFGLCCDIAGIARITHKAGIPLVVDGAHSAHFAYSALLPISPADAGADIWTQSTHKTLPAMNQCACVCVGNTSMISGSRLKRALTKVQTTSPSYLLLASIDYAHAYMRDKGEQELFAIISIADKFRIMVDKLPRLSCPKIAMALDEDIDPLKLIIDVSKTGLSGMTVSKRLAAVGIHIEAADTSNILLLLSVGDTAEQLDLLYKELSSIEKTYGKSIYFSPYSLPPATKYSQKFKFYDNIEKVRVERAVGRHCASTVCVFPPAEVVVHSGQLISFEMAGYILEAKRQGFDVFGIDEMGIEVYEENV